MSWINAAQPECPEGSPCDPVELQIVPRASDIGDFEVRRALPSRKRRMIGPFIFFDQMGPVVFEGAAAMDVRPHPHIGLATVTWLMQGEIRHRDSLGSDQVIRPGAVNWMTAGSGIVHSERTPNYARGVGARMSGIQTWVALPKAHEEAEPEFLHYPADTIPVIEDTGMRTALIVGSAWGRRSPVRTYSDTLYADVQLATARCLELPTDTEERGIYILSGALKIAGSRFDAGRLIVLRPGVPTVLQAESDCQCFVIGGAAMDGPRNVWWNLVSSSRERIEQAKQDWANGRFPKIEGDDEFIPLPEA